MNVTSSEFCDTAWLYCISREIASKDTVQIVVCELVELEVNFDFE